MVRTTDRRCVLMVFVVGAAALLLTTALERLVGAPVPGLSWLTEAVSTGDSMVLLTVGTGSAVSLLQADANTGLALLGIAIGAGLAIGLAAIGGGLGMGTASAAALGAITEKPETFGKSILYVVFIEAVAIYGFVIAYMLLGYIPQLLG